jgi:hypothetical protein
MGKYRKNSGMVGKIFPWEWEKFRHGRKKEEGENRHN